MNCTSLTETPYLPDTVLNLVNAFNSCTSLTTITNLPSGLQWMPHAFFNTAITQIPDIPSGVTEMGYAFARCYELTEPCVIPASVTSAEWVFYDCTKLTGVVTIHGNLTGEGAYLPDEYPLHIFGSEDPASPITLTGDCPQLADIAALYSNVTVK
jgi:hypothetical protein